MATEVLRPRDLFVEGFRVHTASFHRRRTLPENGSLAMKRKQHGRPPKHDRRRFNAAAEAKKPSHGGVTDRRRKGEITSGSPVMGRVTLLRRGESLISLSSKIPKSSESEQKKICLVVSPAAADIYAGSAFTSSPSPRSLPVPSFFNKKDDENSFEDGATRFLRRVLRLE